MIDQKKFEALEKDMEEVLKKHNVEIIIRSELSFKEVETNEEDQKIEDETLSEPEPETD